MLALTRRIDEAIIVGDDIEIKILEINGDKVKIGISAPKDINIFREEIYNQVLESNKSAMCITQDKLKALKETLSRNTAKK